MRKEEWYEETPVRKDSRADRQQCRDHTPGYPRLLYLHLQSLRTTVRNAGRRAGLFQKTDRAASSADFLLRPYRDVLHQQAGARRAGDRAHQPSEEVKIRLLKWSK